MKPLKVEIDNRARFGFVVWYTCPISNIRQAYATCETRREANEVARELRANGLGA